MLTFLNALVISVTKQMVFCLGLVFVILIQTRLLLNVDFQPQ